MRQFYLTPQANGANCANPIFAPGGGQYSATQLVSITCATPGATIYYTIGGATPSQSSPVYGGPITVPTSETLSAIAYAPGFNPSSIVVSGYVILTAAATPTFSPAAGTYSSAQSVQIACSTPGASIYYTTNGTAPTTSSTPYTGAIAVGATETIKAIATASGYTTSAVGSATYTINISQASAPVFSPAAGSYPTTQTVTLSSATPSASIYYTVDGSTPTYPVTGTTTLYSTALTVSASETIKAIAVKSGLTNSSVSTGAYTIGGLQGYKFNPGDYLSSINVYNTSSGSFQGGEVSLLNAGASTATGIMGAVCWYAWPSLETAQGVYNSAPILSDYNALQAANPGLRFGVCIKAAINSNVNTSLLPSRTPNCVPHYIATCGGSLTVNGTTYTLTAQVGNGGTNGYGYGYSGYYTGSPSAYTTCSPLLSDPAVVACLINFWQWLATVKLPYTDGNMYTLDQHPLVEMVIYGDEQSYNFNTGPYPVNTSTGAANDCTVTNWWTGYLNWATAAAAAFPHTMVGANVTFGITDAHGTSEGTNSLNTTNGWLAATCSLGRPGLSGIKGIALCPSDSYGSYWSNSYNSYTRAYSQNSVQSYLGMNPAIGFNQVASIPTSATGVSLKGVMPILNQIQTPDYGSETTNPNPGYFHSTSTQAANTFPWTQAGVVQIAQAANGTTPGPSSAYLNTGTGHRLWQSDDQRFMGSWSTYIHPGIVQAQATYPVNTVVPSSLQAPVNQLGVNLVSLSYYSNEQPFLNLMKGSGNNGVGPSNSIPSFTPWFTSPAETEVADGNIQMNANWYPTSMISANGSQTYTSISTYVNFALSTPPGASYPYPPGSYTLTVTGNCTITMNNDASAVTQTASTGATISGTTLTITDGGTHSMLFNVNTPSTNGLRVVLTATSPSLSNIAIYESAYAIDYATGAIFHPNFLAFMQNSANQSFSAMRSMEWLNIVPCVIDLQFTSTISTSATSATLYDSSTSGAMNWPLPSGTYRGLFASGDIRTCTMTFGSATVTWSGALSAAVPSGTTGLYVPQVQSWAARPQLNDVSWTSGKGIPYEAAISLANFCGIDWWLNIAAPMFTAVLADGGTYYITQLATLVYENLRSPLKVYLEYCNEAWNGNSGQLKFCQILGSAQFPVGPSDAFYAAYEWLGAQTAQVSDLWYSTWTSLASDSGTAFNARVYPTIMTQLSTGNGVAFLQIAMNTPDWTSRAYMHRIRAVGFAPYFGINTYGVPSNADVATCLATSVPLNVMFDWMYSNVDRYGNTYSSVPTNGYVGNSLSIVTGILADISSNLTTWGNPLILCYEIGSSYETHNTTLSGNTAFNTLIQSMARAAQFQYVLNDPQGLLHSTYGVAGANGQPGYLQALKNAGIAFGNYHWDVYATGSTYGEWGLVESVMQTRSASNTPKYVGAMAFVAA